MIRTLNRNKMPPALWRLARLAPLDANARAAISTAIEGSRLVAANRELISEGDEIRRPLLIVSGWAVRVRILADGGDRYLAFCCLASLSVIAVTFILLPYRRWPL